MGDASGTREMITPSPACAPHVVTLANNDQIMPVLYTPFLYFFPALAATPELKRSLARALAAFPPVAGRLRPRALGGGFDLDCNNQGAVFAEVQSLATLHDLLNTGEGDVRGSTMYQPSPLWTSLKPKTDEFVEESKPVLFTQVTRLSCGGAVLAVALHHRVADGTAQDHFVASWAELTRGEELSTPPHLDRSCMHARMPPRRASFEHIEFVVHKEGPPSLSSEAIAKFTRAMPPMTSRIFEFLPEDMKVLKERASANSGESFTGFQALAGHIWEHMTRARGIAPAEVMKFGWAVDGRKRFNPPLPPTYFGNVSFFGLAEQKAGDVMAQPLHDTARTIQSATQRITHEYMQSVLDLVGAQASPALVTGSFVGPADLAMSSWVHFAAYKVDFGCGPPVFFTPAVYAFAQLVILLPHVRGHGAVNALIGMLEPHMQSLLSDHEFYPLR